MDKPVRVTVCAVASPLAKGDVDPYAAVVPYATCELAATFVVQLMLSLEALTAAALTPEIRGGLLTVTETPALVAAFPDVSVAIADNTCVPLATPVVFQLTL